MNYKYFIILFLLFSCSKNEINKNKFPEKYTFMDSIYDVSSKIYYWGSSLPNKDIFDLSSINSPEDMLHKFREFSPNKVDLWSFAIRKENWEKLNNGVSEDFGFGLRFWDNNDLRIAFVFPNSPAELNKLRRGQTVIAINSSLVSNMKTNDIAQILANDNKILLKIKDDNEIFEIELERKVYLKKSILHHTIFKINNLKIGYINIYSFVEQTSKELDSIFDFYKDNNVNQLIIDLRYNGGGLLSTAEDLANKIICSESWNKVFYQTEYNERYKSFGFKTYTRRVSNNLCLSNVSIIISHNTTSASEVFINSVKPYVKTKLIGSKTAGKLLGMHALNYKEYFLFPISFKIYNSLGQHDDYKGIEPDIQMYDDVTSDWNEDEENIRAALGLNRIKSLQSRSFKIDNDNLIDHDKKIEGALYFK